jgi:hypothetical protein
VRRLIQIALLLLVLIPVGGAVFETFDHWDQAAEGGDDLVFNVLGVVVCLALTLLAGFLLRLAVESSLANSWLPLVLLPLKIVFFVETGRPVPSESPPLALRI